MANVVVNDEYLSDIADAIRTKSGTSDTYKPSEMAEAISNIGGSGSPDWVDVTPNLANLYSPSTISNYDSETDTLRVYVNTASTYSRTDVPFTVEVGALYRIELDLVSTVTTCNVGFRDTTNDKVLFGLTRATGTEGHYTYGTIVSDVSTFVDSDHVSIAFYCCWSTKVKGDVTWKNFRIYKYVGGNS